MGKHSLDLAFLDFIPTLRRKNKKKLNILASWPKKTRKEKRGLKNNLMLEEMPSKIKIPLFLYLKLREVTILQKIITLECIKLGFRTFRAE